MTLGPRLDPRIAEHHGRIVKTTAEQSDSRRT
jgi:hypothetical protein